MPTIKDIAREAGVSHGTVSNVINGRGNVSVEKMQLVWQAAEKLGYKVNSKAQSLRQGKDRAIAVLLPGIEDPRWAAMYEVFQSEFLRYGYSVQLYSTRSMEATEQELLSAALKERVSAVIASSCLRDAAAYYRAEAPKLPIALLQREGAAYPGVLYAAFDPETMGREIAWYLRGKGLHRIGVFTEPAAAPDTALFLKGFCAVCGDESTVLDCPNHQVALRAFELFEADRTYDAIVCTDCLRTQAVRAACAYASRAPVPPLISAAVRSAVTDPEVPVYELDYQRLAHRIVKVLIGHLENGETLPGTLYLENSGFRRTVPVPRLTEPNLRMLTMSSPSTTALTRLLPYLEKSTGIHLDLTVLPSLRDVYEVVQTSGGRQYDLIRMDVAWMDELAEKLFQPLREIPFDWDGLLAQTLPEFGDSYTSTGGTRFCVPYDPSIQLLFYRRDLFNDPWKNVLEGFADGSAAMTVVFINYASHILNSRLSSLAGKLGVAPVPGGRPLLGGGVVGITQACAHPETACAFLSWLYSDPVATAFTLLGGLSPCRCAYSNREINEMYPWLSTARKSFPSAQRRGGSARYSNFSELQLEHILASHVQRAVLGVCGPEEALAQAQAEVNTHFIEVPGSL